jgi:hypothetical protein
MNTLQANPQWVEGRGQGGRGVCSRTSQLLFLES